MELGPPLRPEHVTGQPTVVAPRLLGCRLVVRREGDEPVVATIVEVEAYGGLGGDPGSHAHRGLTKRNATMFGPPGSLYCYLSYGIHHCLNVVAHELGQGAAGAVLVRAARIDFGIRTARARSTASLRDRELARGPGRLARALGIDLAYDGYDLLIDDPDAPIRLIAGSTPTQIATGPRVGVGGPGAATPWRFWDAAATEVSAYRPAKARKSAHLMPDLPGRK